MVETVFFKAKCWIFIYVDRPPQFSKGTKFWEYGSIPFPYYVNGCRWRFLSTNFIVNVTQTSSMSLASANGILPKKTVEALLSVNLSLFPIFPANTLFFSLKAEEYSVLNGCWKKLALIFYSCQACFHGKIKWYIRTVVFHQLLDKIKTL